VGSEAAAGEILSESEKSKDEENLRKIVKSKVH
jgi:hypothetical protein